MCRHIQDVNLTYDIACEVLPAEMPPTRPSTGGQAHIEVPRVIPLCCPRTELQNGRFAATPEDRRMHFSPTWLGDGWSIGGWVCYGCQGTFNFSFAQEQFLLSAEPPLCGLHGRKMVVIDTSTGVCTWRCGNFDLRDDVPRWISTCDVGDVIDLPSASNHDVDVVTIPSDDTVATIVDDGDEDLAAGEEFPRSPDEERPRSPEFPRSEMRVLHQVAISSEMPMEMEVLRQVVARAEYI